MIKCIDDLPSLVSIPDRIPYENYRLVIRKMVAKNIRYVINYECDTYNPNEDLSFMFPYKLFDHSIYDESFEEACKKTLFKLKELNYIEVEKNEL